MAKKGGNTLLGIETLHSSMGSVKPTQMADDIKRILPCFVQDTSTKFKINKKLMVVLN